MSRCIVHVGMHKTGSTSIQQSLDGFEDDRFVYAALGADANHSLPVFSLFSDRAERHHLHRAAGREGAALRAFNNGILADFERSIARAAGRTLVVSGEDIGVLRPLELERLRRFLEARFDDYRIVAYVRSPGGFIVSAFQQRVKGGALNKLSPELLYRNFRNAFGKLDEVFGRDRVDLWKFDPKAFPGGCAVRDFCSRIGIAFPEDRIVRMNESLSRHAVATLYAYRVLAESRGWPPMRGPEAARIGALLPGERFRFSPEVLRPVLESNRADIEWMEERLGASLGEDFEDRPGDVRAVDDLLAPDPEAVRMLLGLLGDAVPEGVTGATAEEVALLVHALRTDKDTDARAGGMNGHAVNGRVYRVADILDELRRGDPQLLDGIPIAEAEALVQHVFRHMNNRLAHTDEGILDYAGLGRFSVRKVHREADGEHMTRTRVNFHPLS